MLKDSLLLLHPRNWLIWVGIALTTLVCYLPRQLRDRLVAFLARLAFRRDSKQIRIARTNLRLCFPDWSEDNTEKFLRLYFTRYLQVLVQLPAIWWGSKAAMWRRLEIRGMENLLAQRDAGQPIIMLFNHSMAIDFAAIAMSERYAMRGIYKPFDHPLIEHLFRRSRDRFGAELAARGEDLRASLRALREGRMLVYLCDEDFGAKGSVFAPFFGRPKATLAMLPRLARVSKCKVVPIYTNYEPGTGKFIATIFPALVDYPSDDEVQNATQLNRMHEEMIKICPEQYLWKLRYFRTREDGGESFYQAR